MSATTSPMIRLAPVPFEELPAHPSFPDGSSSESNTRPDLLRFARALLDQGRSLAQPTQFNAAFRPHSRKSSPPSPSEVEILSTTVSAVDIGGLPWSSSSGEILRSKPARIEDEHWFARRSYHRDQPSKGDDSKAAAGGTASWQEFVYGLRDQHSEHECEFTPSLYDARLVCDWTEQVNDRLLASGTAGPDSEGPEYTHATMAVYEMCHRLPAIVGPRCFPVLVATASCSADEFVAVTVPVDIARFAGAFYSNSRNRAEGAGRQMKKAVTLGEYCAVERVVRCAGQTTRVDGGGSTRVQRGQAPEEIEWVMATASHARGNIPMSMQRMGIPGAIAKDVGFFLKWIHNVPEEEIRSQSQRTSAARP